MDDIATGAVFTEAGSVFARQARESLEIPRALEDCIQDYFNI